MNVFFCYFSGGIDAESVRIHGLLKKKIQHNCGNTLQAKVVVVVLEKG